MNRYKKILALGILLLLIGIIPNAGADLQTNSMKKDQKNQPKTAGTLFYDDFNDNTKDFDKWTEIYTSGEWWEQNGQAEFRLYEQSSTNKEGIESIEISVTTKTEPVKIECIMDTFIDNYPDPYYQFIGQPHIMIVDANDPNNKFIDLYYRRDLDQIYLEDSQGTSLNLGTINEFRSLCSFEIEKDKYRVNVGSYTSGYIGKSIFEEKFKFKIRVFIYLQGDYGNYWWKAGFDDVVVEGKKPTNSVSNNIINTNILQIYNLLARFSEKIKILDLLKSIL